MSRCVTLLLLLALAAAPMTARALDDDGLGDPGDDLFEESAPSSVRSRAVSPPPGDTPAGLDDEVETVEPIDDAWFHLDAWASDTAELNLAAQVGGVGAYFFLGGGVDLTSPGGIDQTRFQVGGGFGARLPLNPVFVDFDLGGYGLVDTDGEWAKAALTKMRLGVGYRFASHFAVFAGATANFFFDVDLRGSVPEDLEMFSDEVPDTRVALPTFVEHTYSTSLGDPVRVNIWPGFYVGIEI